MIIIWGTKGFTKIMGYTSETTCNHCNNRNAFQIMRVMTWFTLFWIPLFPVSSRYFIVCPICSNNAKIKKHEALAQSSQNPQQPQLRNSGGSGQIGEHRFAGLSCPACNQPFENYHEVVVCPDCGTPCHRACYTGVCPNFANHTNQ
ncbi:MAG: zinc-ribbon domain-containing protein [Oscillospiraceae bacterium]|nr:zinc-ribbon domain-containing protein [Oscillospiraceae bacterium]